VRNQARWDRYFETVKQQPGIVVTRIEKRGQAWMVAGLKDPKAPDPAQLLGGFGLEPARVRFEWQPYLSLNTPCGAERELDADREEIEKQIIRFEVGSSKLPLAEAGRTESLAAAITRILKARPDSRITVTGHTDEVGSAETNIELSRNRAAQVGDALAAQGVPQAQLELIGIGNVQPVHTGGTDWDKAGNRSVSFHVEVKR